MVLWVAVVNDWSFGNPSEEQGQHQGNFLSFTFAFLVWSEVLGFV